MYSKILRTSIFCLILFDLSQARRKQLKFPKTFKFGTGTSAYQIEGGWNASGKTPSIWDYYTHTFPEFIFDGTNGDIACDSYNQIDVDIENLKFLKVNFYRFSLNWPRLLPHGGATLINPDGVRYYNELIDKLIDNGIEPMITLHQWELPQSVQDLGGWTNRITVDYFEQFVRVAFDLFGDRVKTWITINDPYSMCFYGYEEPWVAPFINSSGIGPYICGHNALLAHATAYHVYQNEFKERQRGEIGIVLDTYWYQAKEKGYPVDELATNRIFVFHFHWFADPIFSKLGDYPGLMQFEIRDYSNTQGFRTSRLPEFTNEEVDFIRGSADFLGINHYSSKVISRDSPQSCDMFPSLKNDIGVDESYDPSWNSTSRDYFKVNPDGLRSILKYVKDLYGNPKVYITENGYAGEKDESMEDEERVWYIEGYLKSLLESIHLDHTNVQRYTHWSLMDNYEWSNGYNMRFGLFHVDFEDPNRTRTPKKSAYIYRDIINRKHV